MHPQPVHLLWTPAQLREYLSAYSKLRPTIGHHEAMRRATALAQAHQAAQEAPDDAAGTPGHSSREGSPP